MSIRLKTETIKIAGICQPGNAAALYKISGNIIVKSGNTSEIITYIPDAANVKYLFDKKYEREDNITDKITTITDNREKNSISSVKSAVKTQYKKRIICPAGAFKVIPPNADKLPVPFYGSFLFSLT